MSRPGHISARTEARDLLRRFKALEARLQAPLQRTIDRYAADAADQLRDQLSKPVTAASGRAKLKRSRPGQPPRMQTGKLRNSIRIKAGRNTYSRYVTLDAERNGARYPFMLESGTRRIKKRPVIKRVQRKLRRPLAAAVLADIKRALHR